jgi:hypothetical protein
MTPPPRVPCAVCLLLCCVQLADPWKRAKDMLLQGSVVDGMISGFNKRGSADGAGRPAQRVRGGEARTGGGAYEVELDRELKGEKGGGLCREPHMSLMCGFV